MFWASGNPYTPAERGVRVARARNGLPLILSAPLRKLIRQAMLGGSLKGWVALRVALTILSVYRVISCRPVLKLETITSPFSGQSATLPSEEVRHAITQLGGSLRGSFKASASLFSESAGPNYPRATWSCGLDALAYWCSPLQWWHFSVIAVRTSSWTLWLWLVGVMLITAPVVPLLVILGVMPTKLGRLAKLYEAAGKVRVVAITDWWTQCLLLPLHQNIFDRLQSVRMDGTHNQTGSLVKLNEISQGRPAFSFDLSAATDRLPVALQVQILQALGLVWADAWAALLTKRPWWLGSRPVKYAVGQPMGAYSSWAMLALTHHVIVQVAAFRAGWRHMFPYYAVLGDDIVIRDSRVAGEYQNLMATLGVPINMSKSLVSEKGCLEFAKRWIHPDLGDFTPLGPGLILVTIRNLRFIPLLVNELATKSFSFLPAQMKDLMSLVGMLRRKVDSNLPKVISLLALGPSGGLWGSGQLADRSAAWIAAYHKSVSPDLLSLHVYHACCAYTIVKANQSLKAHGAAEWEIKSRWLEYPILGRSLAMAILSAPLMLVSPGLWATLAPFLKGFNLSVSWESKDSKGGPSPFELNAQAARTLAVRDVAATYIGTVSALNWADRRKVLDFFAAQNFLCKEVERTLKEGLYGAGSLVPYVPGGAVVSVPRT